MDDYLNIVRKSIIEDVFVTKDKARIIGSRTGKETNWLMDFRRVLLRPEILNAVSEIVFHKIRERSGSFQVGGLEVASIPMVSGIVMKSFERGFPINGFFIRKSRKKTGLLNMIEGSLSEDSIVLVDDIINSGSSFIRQVEVIEALGKKVAAVVAVLRFRDLEYYGELYKRGIEVYSIFSLNDFSGSLELVNLVKEETQPTPYPFIVDWIFRSPKPHLEYVVPKSAPALSEGVLYFGSDSGIFWAIDSNTGHAIWSHKVLFGSKGKTIFSSPVTSRDTVFFGSYDGNFYALDKKKGNVKWVAYDADWIGSSPCIADDLGLVYVGMEFGFWKRRGGVAAYDIKTGKRIWQSHSSMYTHCSPVYSKKNHLVICGSNDGIVYGLDAKTGNIKWTYNARGEVKASCALSWSEKYLAFGSFNKQYVILETKTGKLVACFDTLEINYSTPTWNADSILVATSLDKRIYCFDVANKSMKWEFSTNARIFASPVISGNSVYIGNNSAQLYVLDLNTGKKKALFQAVERITNKVVIEGDSLYLPTYANEIVKLRIPSFLKRPK